MGNKLPLVFQRNYFIFFYILFLIHKKFSSRSNCFSCIHQSSCICIFYMVIVQKFSFWGMLFGRGILEIFTQTFLAVLALATEGQSAGQLLNMPPSCTGYSQNREFPATCSMVQKLTTESFISFFP